MDLGVRCLAGAETLRDIRGAEQWIRNKMSSMLQRYSLITGTSAVTFSGLSFHRCYYAFPNLCVQQGTLFSPSTCEIHV